MCFGMFWIEIIVWLFLNKEGLNTNPAQLN